MRSTSVFLVAVLSFLIISPGVGSVSSYSPVCFLVLTTQPPVVNFPSLTLPSPSGLTFAETIDLNYSSSLANQTITIQYLNGSAWTGLQTVSGNGVGFTEVYYGLDSNWAKFGANMVRAVSGSCVSDPTSFRVQADPSATLSDVAIYVVLILLVMLFFLAGKKLGLSRLLLISAAAYLAVSPFTGQRYDIYFLLSSGIRVLQHVNPFDPGSPPMYPSPLKWAYPPLYATYSAFSFLLYQLVTGATLPTVQGLTWPGWLTSTYNVFEAYMPSSLPVLVLLLKLPMVACAILTGILLKRMTGKETAALIWVANPLVILVAALWGQLDPIATLLAVASVYAFQKQKPSYAYFFASLGAAVKVWPVIIIPIMLAIRLRNSGLKEVKPLIAILPALLATLALYSVFGNTLESLFVLVYARGIPTFAGAFTVNGLTWQEVLFVLKAPPIPLFLCVGIPLYAAMLGWILWKKDDDIVKWVTIFILIFFLTYNYVNPQYFYWLVPFLILQSRKLITLIFTALPLAFIALAYNAFYFVSPALLSNEFAFGASVVDQIKVTAFYQSQFIFVLVAGVIPTFAYLTLLYLEAKGKTAKSASGQAERVTVNT